MLAGTALASMGAVSATALIENDTFEGLAALGEQLGSFLTGITPGIIALVFAVGLIGAVVAIIFGVASLIKRSMHR